MVRRVLPRRVLRKVGPWVFVDHFGPTSSVVTGERDVLPHPHCGLSTVSFLFEGATEHRDSTGGHAIVRPNEVHWMRAGHGIVHSERAPKDRIGQEQRSHGLQLWCAHPDGEEEQEPRFDSWRELPTLDVQGVRVDLLAGHGWGAESPVDVTSPLVYAVAHMAAGQTLWLPDHAERAVYVVSGAGQGAVVVDGQPVARHQLLSVGAGAHAMRAMSDCVVAILGGASIGERFIWWNLVHSNRERLREQAERWRRGEFPTIPGDDTEFIAAPELGP